LVAEEKTAFFFFFGNNGTDHVFGLLKL